jgi:hypothetical protein
VKDFIGVALLFGGYTGTALLLAYLGDMPIERALLFIGLFVLSQLRWFSRDESPLTTARPKRSLMAMFRGE